MEFNKNIDCYVINLDERKDRLEKFDDQMKKLNIQYERFSAKTDKDGLNMFGMKPGQLGCAASHYRLIEQAYNNKSTNYTCIFEDDALFCEDFHERFKYLNEHIHNYDWDIIYLSAFHHMPHNVNKHMYNNKSPYLDKKTKIMKTFSFTNHKHIHKMNSSFVMVGYILNPAKIDKIYKTITNELPIPLQKISTRSRAIDHILMNMMEENKINVYSYVPGMIGQYPSYSNIEKKDVNINQYFLQSNVCGQHVFVNNLKEFNYDKYFSK